MTALAKSSRYIILCLPLVTIDPNLSAEAAANVMLQNKVRHLVVKDGDRPVGIITASNFIYYLDEQSDRDDPNARGT